jgi:phosphate transport system substrate-binding protein
VVPGRAQQASPVAAVQRDPFALGVTTLSESGGTRPLTLRGPCGFPTSATADALKTEDYPLTLPVYLHHPPRRLPRLAREFVGFIRSPAAQDAVRAAGFVDLSVDRVPFAVQGNRLSDAILSGADGAGLAEVQRMVTDLRDHDRLTMAFRFRDGSSALDSHSQSNVALLADAFERGVYDGHDVIFAGFSDGQGDAAANLRLSRQRARAVRDALLAEIPGSARDFRDRVLAEGYGEAAPIACDEEDWGSRLNRRVEVWVRQR